MRVNNVQTCQKSEIVATSRKPVFQAKTVKNTDFIEPLLPKEVIDHFGLNMDTAVKYRGQQSYTPAPDSLGEKLAGYLHQLQVDWETHIDPKHPRKSFE